VIGDIGNQTELRQALQGIDAILHFAAHAYVAESVENPRKYFDNNVRSGLSLLNETLDVGVRYFIFSSSCAVYGTPMRTPICEEMNRDPENSYGASKVAFELALEAYARAYGLSFASLRYFNAAGADESAEIGELHDPETHLIPRALEVAAGLREELKIYGDDYPTHDGTCIRDYVHVNDLAEAHVLALEYLVNGGGPTALNLGTGTPTSIRELINAVESVTGRLIRRRVAPRRPGDAPVLIADASKAGQVLSWRATRTLEEIIFTAWTWMQKGRVLKLSGTDTGITNRR
jgi:UDP-glucose 4-epimerase